MNFFVDLFYFILWIAMNSKLYIYTLLVGVCFFYNVYNLNLLTEQYALGNGNSFSLLSSALFDSKYALASEKLAFSLFWGPKIGSSLNSDKFLIVQISNK